LVCETMAQKILVMEKCDPALEFVEGGSAIALSIRNYKELAKSI
jgi:hypothetical protein